MVAVTLAGWNANVTGPEQPSIKRLHSVATQSVVFHFLRARGKPKEFKQVMITKFAPSFFIIAWVWTILSLVVGSKVKSPCWKKTIDEEMLCKATTARWLRTISRKQKAVSGKLEKMFVCTSVLFCVILTLSRESVSTKVVAIYLLLYLSS